LSCQGGGHLDADDAIDDNEEGGSWYPGLDQHGSARNGLPLARGEQPVDVLFGQLGEREWSHVRTLPC
jgi:hypothetical protein